MTFAVILVVTAVASVVLAGALGKVPWLFYGVAIVAVAIMFAGFAGMLEGGWWKPLILLVLRCMLAPAALNGGEPTIVGVVVYTALFGGYAIGRIARGRLDSAKACEPTE